MRRLGAVLVFIISTPRVFAQCSGCFHPSFDPAIRAYPTYSSNFLLDMVSADFDMDGFPDLAGAVGDGFALLRGTGGGSFQPMQRYASAGSTSIVTADFDGDGLPDVATAGTNVSVFLGKGDGTFESPIEHTPDFYGASSAVTEDFNEDGIPDLALESLSLGGIRVYIGNGDGTLQLPTRVSALFSGILTVGDFNADGHADIAAAAPTENAIRVFLGDGHGGFSAPLLSGRSGSALAVGDFNFDGISDLAAAAAEVQILLGTGDGHFIVGSASPAGDPPSSIATGDFNRDGVVDLAASGYQDGNVYVLAGNGDGTFAGAVGTPAGDNLELLLARDFNADGRLDVAVGSEALVEVLLADEAGKFSNATTYPTGGSSGPIHPPAIALGELTGDGFADIAVTDVDTLTVRVLPGSATGQLQSPISLATASVPQQIVAGHFRPGANQDLAVATDSGIQIILSNGDGTFLALPLSGAFASIVLAADFTNDGDEDLAWVGAELTVWLSNGDGTFTAGPPIPGSPAGDALAIADFDGDGVRDIALSKADLLIILVGGGDGSFTVGSSYSSELTGNTSIAAGDFDGDGRDDVAAVHYSGDVFSDLQVYWGNGDGTLESPVLFEDGLFPQDMIASDVNGDGRVDLVQGEYREVRVYASRSDRAFEQSSWVRPVQGGRTTVGDVDGDSKPDIASAGGLPPEVGVLFNTICVPSRLAVVIQPESCTSGTPFLVQPVLRLLDGGGNLMTCDTGTISATLLPETGTPGAALGGNAMAPVVDGVATFTDLSIDRGGRGYLLEFSHPVGSVRSRKLTQDLGVVVTGVAATCSGTPTIYRTALGGYDRYQWSLDGIPTSRGEDVVLVAEAGSHLLSLTVYQDGCAASDVISIELQQSPSTPFIVAPTSARVGEIGILASATHHHGSSYQWSITGGTIVSGQGTSQITVSAGPPGTTMGLRVTETSLGGCSSPEGSGLIQVDFADSGESAFREVINSLARHGITKGCGGGNYCPDSEVTRAQAAVFLLRAKHGAGFTPGPAIGIFGDVPVGSFAADWIERLYLEGITAGCAVGHFCPSDPITRAQAAVLLLKSKHGSSYSPPACTGVFEDVSCSPVPAFAVDWVERLFAEGVTSGCSEDPLLYCPCSLVTRGQMAALLVRAFNLR